MGQKQKAAQIDFQIGLGNIIPSSQRVFSQQHQDDNNQLKIFKQVLAESCEKQLQMRKEGQFPSGKNIISREKN